MCYLGTMSSENTSKINQLLSSQPLGVVMQSFWLAEQGYSLDLQKRYRNSNWLKSIGTGAMIRAGDQVSYEGAIYALQQQNGSAVHPGGRTALSLLGKSHYLELATNKVTIFAYKGEKLPGWFRKHDWGVKVEYYPSSFLPADIGLTNMEIKSFSIKISGAARAVMECLYQAPEKQSLLECYELMEGLNNLRPTDLQPLLEKCQSVKVNRLFMYLAEKAGHEWFKYLDINKIDLGKGKRSIVKNGVYISKYKITVPKELEEHDKTRI
jgi:hypothetical protein